VPDNVTRSVPHYIRDYERHCDNLIAKYPGDIDRAMAELVGGGDHEGISSLQRAVVTTTGLAPGMNMVDIGCGVGRTAYGLRHEDIGYLGIDVIGRPLEYARNKVNRPDWRFEVVTDCTIPATDASIDYICAFSVFTHIKHEETFHYLREAHRVLKPGGHIVFSFLDFADNWDRFVHLVRNVDDQVFGPLDQFIDRATLPTWADRLGLDIARIYGAAEHFFPKEPVRVGDAVLTSFAAGHSYCVMRKP